MAKRFCSAKQLGNRDKDFNGGVTRCAHGGGHASGFLKKKKGAVPKSPPGRFCAGSREGEKREATEKHARMGDVAMTRTLPRDRTSDRRSQESARARGALAEAPRISPRGEEVLAILNHIFDSLSAQQTSHATTRQ